MLKQLYRRTMRLGTCRLPPHIRKVSPQVIGRTGLQVRRKYIYSLEVIDTI
jgi:hypothetical protein